MSLSFFLFLANPPEDSKKKKTHAYTHTHIHTPLPRASPFGRETKYKRTKAPQGSYLPACLRENFPKYRRTWSSIVYTPVDSKHTACTRTQPMGAPGEESGCARRHIDDRSTHTTFFPLFFPFNIFALLFYLSPNNSCNSDLGSQSMLFSPLPLRFLRLAFLSQERFSTFFPRRRGSNKLCLPTLCKNRHDL